ncbi:MAG: hypothetical protein MK207_05730 [Saprospiraceae bacterium]|nr:hypothetical protein [Saprospiraceae bacterium]
MKNILGAIFIFILFSSSSVLKKEQYKGVNINTSEQYLITTNSVGVFSKEMTISDVYKIIPKDQIKIKISTGEFEEDNYEDYEIYDSTGAKILILTPKKNGDLSSKINRILILDNRYKTKENIGLNSTYGDLAKHYSTNKIYTDMDHIVIETADINAWFSIKKSDLLDGWWDGNGIDRSKIPKTAKFDQLSIWWQ